jgi:hypothetical protein
MNDFLAPSDWEGEYSYVHQATDMEVPGSIRFSLNIKEVIRTTFSGIVQDHPMFGSIDAAKVRGEINGRAIRFTKIYPTIYVYNSDAVVVTLAEYYWTEQEIRLDCDAPASSVEYEGTFNPDTGFLTGSWRLEPKAVQVLIEGLRHYVDLPGSYGHWKAHRVGIQSI